jgi:CBS domain-containing protein
MTLQTERGPRLFLRAETAADLMSANPVSIRDTATIAEAVALLTDKGFSGAPVIDEAGRPIGVLSRADIIAHDRERIRSKASASGGRSSGWQAEKPGPTRARDLMTPAVFSITPEMEASKVISEMLALNVHRLFVVDKSGVLVGVISALDVLRHLEASSRA